MPAIRTFGNIENKHDINRGEGYMKQVCECLREHKMKLINFEKKKMIPLKKWTTGIAGNLPQLGKNLNINTLNITTITKLGTIATTLVQIKQWHIVTIVYLRKFLSFFTGIKLSLLYFTIKELVKVFEGEF